MTGQALVRPTAVAGTFYPDDPASLRAEVQGYLAAAAAADQPDDHDWPKALIVPHAGYIYSGPTAGVAYSRLKAARGKIKRVVLLGPAHRVAIQGLAVPAAKEWASPLGTVTIDQAGVAEALTIDCVSQDDLPHAQEHSLEVQIPFLKEALGSFQLLPFVVGQADPMDVAQILTRFWGGPDTLVVISSDLSHFNSYTLAQRTDNHTCKAIELLDSLDLREGSACGRLPIQGLLEVARLNGMRVTTLDYRNSGDTAGDKDSVVGYGAYMVEENRRARLPEHHWETLKETARTALRYRLEHGQPMPLNYSEFPRILRNMRATFVTLTDGGILRGCIGSIKPQRPLIEDVVENAYASALKDPRFDPLTLEELDDLEMEIAILSLPAPLDVDDELDLHHKLRPMIDGVILREGGQGATFLPKVWQQLPEPHAFLSRLKQKAGLSGDYWSRTMTFETYQTETYQFYMRDGFL